MVCPPSKCYNSPVKQVGHYKHGWLRRSQKLREVQQLDRHSTVCKNRGEELNQAELLLSVFSAVPSLSVCACVCGVCSDCEYVCVCIVYVRIIVLCGVCVECVCSVSA